MQDVLVTAPVCRFPSLLPLRIPGNDDPRLFGSLFAPFIHAPADGADSIDRAIARVRKGMSKDQR
jgi:hypothetical protein